MLFFLSKCSFYCLLSDKYLFVKFNKDLALQAISHEVEVGKMGGDSNKKRAFSQKLFLYRFSIGINFFKVKKIVLGY